MNKQQLSFLLKKYNTKPRREQGQNFLLDEQVIKDTITAAQLTKDDTVLEIGPGFGFLTTELAHAAGKVIAVEQDRDLFPAITTLAKTMPNIEPHNQDIRTFNIAKAGFQDRQYKLVANLPYNITSWILRYFLESQLKPSVMVVMVQKEVAERVIAQPGNMSILACAVQLYAQPEIIRIVTKDAFSPVPKVDSAILKLTIRETPRSPDPEQLMRLIKIGFAAKRKQLHNTLQAGLKLTPNQTKQLIESAGLPANVRPQELSLQQWENVRSALTLQLS